MTARPGPKTPASVSFAERRKSALQDTDALRVVVGFDGSHRCWPAIVAAAHEARQRGLSLDLVTIPLASQSFDLSMLSRQRVHDELVDHTLLRLHDMTDEIQHLNPDLVVTMHVLEPRQNQRMAAQLTGCELLVVGARGNSNKRAFAMGSVSRELAHGAKCPVLVVPERWNAELPVDGPVVAAIDGRDLSHAVVGFAADEAIARQRPLTLVHCRKPGPGQTLDDALAEGRELCQHLAAAVSRPGLEVQTRVFTEPPAVVMAAQEGPLVVMGSHGLMALAGLGLNATSRDMLDAARVPVMVLTAQSVQARQQATPRQVATES